MTESGESEGLLVGIEIHQQLSCSTKLFCACPPVKSEQLPYQFERRLRPAQSETGRVDPAAIFEYSKGKSNQYYWSPESSCLVEADEEPPHPLSAEALESALLTALTLHSNIVDEVHVMRKIVIDGSNTAGFQRTAVVGLGGEFRVEGTEVGVQSVTIEEDAARILGETESARQFSLDRLGVALVEIALDPIRGDPEFVGRVALHLGRMLRSTGRVARGLGTIRQDLNVSFMGGKVVEVKGVQKLNLLPRVVEYERKRQGALAKVAARLSEKGISRIDCQSKDVTKLLSGTASSTLSQLLHGGGKAVCISAGGLGGVIGWEPEPGVRLGKELAEVARANSLGGIIHSDEFEKQGVPADEAADLRKEMGCSPDDGMVIVIGKGPLVDKAVSLLVERLKATPAGVPAETRAATDSGETRYMRPRPGAQRMYPETDIPDIPITREQLRRTSKSVPEDWEYSVRKIQESYSLSRDLALKLFDSEVLDEFDRATRELKLEPSYIASTLVDLPTRLAREGVPEEKLTPERLIESLEAVASGLVAKEAVPDVLTAAANRGTPVREAVATLGIKPVGEQEVEAVVDSLLARESALVREKGDGAFSALMGEAMKELRGRVDGALVARVLKRKLQDTTAG
jgi:glutamyl-tRNA(Gln) amidotransferase subunit E